MMINCLTRHNIQSCYIMNCNPQVSIVHLFYTKHSELYNMILSLWPNCGIKWILLSIFSVKKVLFLVWNSFVLPVKKTSIFPSEIPCDKVTKRSLKNMKTENWKKIFKKVGQNIILEGVGTFYDGLK